MPIPTEQDLKNMYLVGFWDKSKIKNSKSIFGTLQARIGNLDMPLVSIY
jgi:hypothetical protein